jgi:GNAT superfamily N-acetyltransferase
MRIEQWDPADEKTLRACHDLALAAHEVDDQVEPPPTYGLFAFSLRGGWDPTPAEVWVASGGDDSVVGYYRISLPDLENLDEANAGPLVHPAARRHGIGRELLRHAGGRAAAHGRTRFGAATTAGTAGDAFARAIGARLDIEEVRRIQYLSEIAPGTIAMLRASADKAADGYSLVSWDGPIPDEYLGPMAEIFNAFADAPHGENTEPEVWDADRVRERTGKAVRAGLLRSHSVAAVCDSTGEMAAFTEIGVIPEHASWGWQQLTAVIRTHRGHRLGLLVKMEMLSLLASAEPQLERIATGNAASNQHMIAVNEQLGYRVVGPCWRFYEMPVAATG